MTKCHVCGESALGVDGLVHFCPECMQDLCQPCGYAHAAVKGGECYQTNTEPYREWGITYTS